MKLEWTDDHEAHLDAYLAAVERLPKNHPERRILAAMRKIVRMHLKYFSARTGSAPKKGGKIMTIKKKAKKGSIRGKTKGKKAAKK